MIEQLLFLALDARWPMLAEWLHDPTLSLVETADPDGFESRLSRLRALMAPRPDLVGLLEVRLAVEWLLARDLKPKETGGWLEAGETVSRWLPAAVQACLEGRWMAVPVVLTDAARRGAIRYFIAGRLPADHSAPLLSPWAGALCDRSAREAIAMAARLAAQPPWRFHVLPLLAPGAGIAVCGPSLGLPLAIALRQLCVREAFPEGVVATGALEEDGGLVAVSGLKSKCREAVRRRIRHMIYPAIHRKPKGFSELGLHPAADLDEAVVLSLLAGRGWQGPGRLFARMLADADAFVAHCGAVPADWIDWAACTGRLEPVRDRVVEDAERLAALARQIERLTEAGRYRDAAVVSDLVTPAAMEALPVGHLDSAFRWAVNCLTLANRRGEVVRGADWDRVASRLAERAMHTGQLDAMAHYSNIAFVHREQGRYHFTPDLPETIVTLEAGLARRAEAHRALGCSVDPVYGALCGTLAQHFGFCGPAWIEAAEGYIGKAQTAFGDGLVPERRADWLRLLNYRCYARLDAGDRQGAQADLMAYLEEEDWDEVLQKIAALDRWQHALLARFLADAGPVEVVQKYLDRTAGMVQTAPPVHPWQLWANNLGRMAVRIDEAGAAEGYYRCALARCRQGGMGPTVQVMALLPLAGLDALGALDSSALEETVAAVRRAAAHLDPEHLQPVFEMDPAALLALVRDSPRRLFPFSYR